MGNVLSVIQNESKFDPAGKLRLIEEKCKNCNPITPLQCIDGCKVYKLKNELRKLRGTMDNPNYMTELFNVLKNDTRLCTLQVIARRRCSVSQIQRELRKTGYRHSQENIAREYLRPLMVVGLVAEAQDEYYATTFGGRLNQLVECFPEFADKLPARSESYEETLLQALLSGPRNFEEIKGIITQKNASRILKRLSSAHLISSPPERDYIFFLKSKRDPKKELFTTAEKKVYDSVTFQGISAGKLTKEIGFSIRRTYKYLRRFKGRKLVFTRRKPKTYCLTSMGKKLATLLQEIEQIVEDTWNSTEQITREESLVLNFGSQ